MTWTVASTTTRFSSRYEAFSYWRSGCQNDLHTYEKLGCKGVCRLGFGVGIWVEGVCAVRWRNSKGTIEVLGSWRGVLWRHDMETLPALLTLREGNPRVTGGFLSQRASNKGFFFFIASLDKVLNKQLYSLLSRTSCWSKSSIANDLGPHVAHV